jgi:hypothetical protein
LGTVLPGLCFVLLLLGCGESNEANLKPTGQPIPANTRAPETAAESEAEFHKQMSEMANEARKEAKLKKTAKKAP